MFGLESIYNAIGDGAGSVDLGSILPGGGGGGSDSGGFNPYQLLAAAAGPTISGLGNYFIANQGQQDSEARLQEQQQFQQAQDTIAHQRNMEMAQLRAALDKSAGSAAAAARIKAQTDREKMLQEAYLASMSNALQSGQIIGNQLGGVADRMTQMRLAR